MEQLFSVHKFTSDQAKKMSGFVFEPHSHDFEELVICSQGTLNHFIDFKNSHLRTPIASFVSKGKFHRISFDVDEAGCYPQGWVFRFKSTFIPESRFQLYASFHEYANVLIEEGRCFDRMSKICDVIVDEANQPLPDYAIIRSLLSSLFILIESERKKSDQSESVLQSTQNITFKSFLQILEDNFRRDKNVDFYAEKLNMSVRNLNLICQNILQKSVSEIIETRKLTEAKSLLLNSDKPISEIGYELGYNEKAYFTNVFKKKAGMTPTEFRTEMGKLIS